jgi:beta-galactosidase
MFDFSSRIRREGDAIDVNTKGLVSYDRKVKKDAYYYYKSQWSASPVVHITSRRFTKRADSVTRIKIYSNAPAVALSLNGMPLGEVACIDSVCVRENVVLGKGLNLVIASAVVDGQAFGDRVEWTLVE